MLSPDLVKGKQNQGFQGDFQTLSKLKIWFGDEFEASFFPHNNKILLDRQGERIIEQERLAAKEIIMTNQKNYKKTLIACYLGFVTQAISANFAPLLFLTFQRTYHISLEQLALLITFNFGMQLLIDLLSSKFIDKIGCRASIVIAHIVSAIGLTGLAVLPEILGDVIKS